MRAQSKVWTHVQEPTTIFWMAPTHIGICLAIAGLSYFVLDYVVFVVIDYGISSVALGLSGVVGVGACWKAIALRRADPHCDTLTRLPLDFYKSGLLYFPLKKQRISIAGTPPDKSKKWWFT